MPRKSWDILAGVSVADKRRIVQALISEKRDGVPMPAELGALLLNSAEQCLARPGRGGVPTEKANLYAKRDALIVDGWRSIPEWRKHEPWGAATRMSTGLRRYENGRWKSDRHGVTTPIEPIAAIGYSLLKLDNHLPGKDAIYKILKSATA